MPRRLARGGASFIYVAKSCGRTSKGPFNSTTLAGELTTILLLIRSRGIRGTGSVQLEYPDGSSWMDRRVDKQIATREGGQEGARSDPPIYMFFILPTLLSSDASGVLKNQRVPLFRFKTDQICYVRRARIDLSIQIDWIRYTELIYRFIRVEIDLDRISLSWKINPISSSDKLTIIT